MVAPSNVAVDNLLERLVAAAPAAEKEEKMNKSGASGGGIAGVGDDSVAIKTGGNRKVRAVRLGHPARQSQGVLAHSLDAVLSRSDGNLTLI
jgi:hypothetical protein